MTERLEKAIQRVLRSGAKLGAGDQELQSHYNALTELRRAHNAEADEFVPSPSPTARSMYEGRPFSPGNGWTH